MNSLYEFIIEPLGDRYDNRKQINDKELILNTSIETFKAVNNIAVVKGIPKAFDTPIKVGMEVVVHHNVFRRWYDVKGREKNSKSYFKDNLFFCSVDQLYLYKDKQRWNSFNDRCFIKPIKDNSLYDNKKIKSNLGILYYSNDTLTDNDIFEGDIVGYRNGREFEFTINNELLFCMKSHDIIITYENKGNEKEYNPSWAHSGRGVNKSSKRRNCRYGGGCVCGSTQKCCRNKEASHI